MVVPDRQLAVRGVPWGLEPNYPSSKRPNNLSPRAGLSDSRFTGQILKFDREMNRWAGRNPFLSGQETLTDLARKLKSINTVCIKYFTVYTDNDHKRRKIDVKRGVKFAGLNNIDVIYEVYCLIFGLFSLIRIKLSKQPYFFNNFN